MIREQTLKILKKLKTIVKNIDENDEKPGHERLGPLSKANGLTGD